MASLLSFVSTAVRTLALRVPVPTTSNVLAATVQSPFLQPPSTVNLIQAAGFKVKGHLRRRCKDCYFVRKHERLYVLCRTHGRHKQMSMKKKPENTWMLSHATMSKFRPW